MSDGAIVVGFDGSVGSHAALFAAIDLACATRRSVAVVHVEHIQPIVAAGAASACQLRNSTGDSVAATMPAGAT